MSDLLLIFQAFKPLKGQRLIKGNNKNLLPSCYVGLKELTWVTRRLAILVSLTFESTPVSFIVADFCSSVSQGINSS
jgi:hypothetical protein